MRQVVFSFAILASAFVAQAPSADAQVKNFFNPSVDRNPISFCLSDSETCGKPIADTFCQLHGYDQAVLFQRLQRNAQSSRHAQFKFVDTGGFCDGDGCLTFRQIKCYRPEGQQS